MINLIPFQPSDFDKLISWVDSEELLVTIAGTYFTYPLTAPQLHCYLEDKSSTAFTVVETHTGKAIGHAEIIAMGDGLYKLDKVIVGEKTDRGKGIGGMVIRKLLKYSFEKLKANEVELNVFDWNIAGIKCYQREGFVVNENKIQTVPMNGATWIAKNMTISRERWVQTCI